MFAFPEILLVPFLLALSWLAIWFVARHWKRKPLKASEVNAFEEQTSAVVSSPDEFAGVVSRSLSGMEDHDFQSLNPRSSKLATLDPAVISATRPQQDDEESIEFADLDEDDELEEVDARKSTDRSFDEREDDEPAVFPHSPEPSRELSNDVLWPTDDLGKSSLAGSRAKPGKQYRRDAAQPTKPDALRSTFPLRIPLSAVTNSVEAAAAEKAGNDVLPAPFRSSVSNDSEVEKKTPASPATFSDSPPVMEANDMATPQAATSLDGEPKFAVPKYSLTAHPFKSTLRDTPPEPAAQTVVELNAQMAEVTKQRDATRAENSRLTDEIENFRSAATAAEGQITELQTELQTSEEKLARLEQEKLTWQIRLAEANQRLADTAGEEAAQVKQLTDYSRELSARLAKLESERAVAESRTASFQDEATQTKAQAAELLAERNSLQAQVVELMERLQAERDQRSELTISKTMLESSLAALTNQLAQRESEQKKLASDRNMATRLLEQSRQKQAELEAALKTAELSATELRTIRDKADRLQQEQQLLKGQIASLQSERTRDQLELEKLWSLTKSREQELLQARSEMASRVEAEELGKQFGAQQLPADSEEEPAHLAEIQLQAGKLEQAARQSESQVASLMQQIAEMERSAAQQHSQLSAANLSISQLQVELQGAEETAGYLEMARNEALNSLEQERIARRGAAEHLQDLPQKLREQSTQIEQLATERLAISNQLEIVRRDQEVAVSERNRFKKELTLAELNTAQLRADCQAYLEQLQQLQETNAALLGQLETNQQAETKPQATRVATDDDLTRISGIGKVLAGKLRGAGVTTFEQIMNWDQQTIGDLTARLGLSGRIQRDGWQEQAARFVQAAKERGHD